MTILRTLGQALLSSLVWMAVSALLRSEFKLAYVTDHSLFYCACVHELPPCSLISPSDCTCKDQPFSLLQRSDSSSAIRVKRLTVWYRSSLNAARLLNNSEVRHLTLIKCNSGGSKPAPQPSPGSPAPSSDCFAVQHLERLTVLYPVLRPGGGPGGPGQSQDIVLGRDMGAAYHEEARLGIIHSSVLQGTPTVKAYTVLTHIDSNGILPFPNIFLSKLKLPETESIFVSFIY